MSNITVSEGRPKKNPISISEIGQRKPNADVPVRGSVLTTWGGTPESGILLVARGCVGFVLEKRRRSGRLRR